MIPIFQSLIITLLSYTTISLSFSSIQSSSETVKLIDLLDAAKDRMKESLQARADEGKCPLKVRASDHHIFDKHSFDAESLDMKIELDFV